MSPLNTLQEKLFLPTRFLSTPLTASEQEPSANVQNISTDVVKTASVEAFSLDAVYICVERSKTSADAVLIGVGRSDFCRRA